jgi:hypothetical protein
VDDIIAELTNTPLRLFDTDLQILENNIYGVDINDESIEIAKLSLWLRTAQPGRKLSDLSRNIRCGNSLIDDPAVAGDKAFNWQQAFPDVFEKARTEQGRSGGFDVVIGNPPYVRVQGLKEHYYDQTLFYESNYTSATGNYDIYALFMEKSFQLISDTGIVSFILPHKFLVTDFGVGIRKFFVENSAVESLVHFGSELVFSDASTYTCIVNLSRRKKDKVLFKKISPTELLESSDWDYMFYKNLSSNNWDLQSEKIFDVIAKLNKQPFRVEDVFDKIFQGIATSLDEVYVFQGKEENGIIYGFNSKYEYQFQIEKEFVKPILGGKEVSKYRTPEVTNYVIFPYHIEKSAVAMTEEYISSHYPLAYAYLKRFENEIRGREKGKMNIENGWFNYIYPKNLTYFKNPKIITREISLGCNMTYDEQGTYYHNTKVYSFIKKPSFNVDDKYYLGILNSSVMWFYLKNTGSEYGGGYYVFKTNYLKPFPLPEISKNAAELISKVDFILKKNIAFKNSKEKFCSFFMSNFHLASANTKLTNWHTLTFPDFIKELNKAIKASKGVPLTKKDEFEWMELFEENKKKVVDLKTQIDQTDREIDRMVYALYGLTEEEIAIVEGS